MHRAVGIIDIPEKVEVRNFFVIPLVMVDDGDS